LHRGDDDRSAGPHPRDDGRARGRPRGRRRRVREPAGARGGGAALARRPRRGAGARAGRPPPRHRGFLRRPLPRGLAVAAEGGRPMRIAMVSEHASPLAALGGEDAGGQNVHVAALATALARRGHDVAVYTRRDDPDLPERVEMLPGVQVVHVPAGPARVLPKDHLLPFMPALGRWLADHWRRRGAPDVVHSHFWMSGLAALVATAAVRVPVVHTYHALGTVKRRHQGAKDPSPPSRLTDEVRIGTEVDLVVATCRDELAELTAMGVDPARVRIVPCGVDVRLFSPDGERYPPRGTTPFRLLSVGRLVERKGVDTVIAALPLLPEAELLVAGGPVRSRIHTDPEAVRLHALA